MNRICMLAVSSVFLLALSAVAQQPTTSPDTQNAASAAPAPHAVQEVEQHLKMLSEKLDLTADQQAKARPILQQMHDGSQKLHDDPTLTPEQRQAAMHPLFIKADQQMREFLTDDQKKKLDDMEAQMHHDQPTGSPSTSPQN
jgi:Spy/CpxP family protein refolding chaperone